ncbi:MAG: BON domain-containing protein, partial [Polyangiaceae bacterium]
PLAEPIPDARLAVAITDAIAADPVLRSEAVRVSVASGQVMLGGTVRTLAQKWRAERLAGGFKGAVAVTDGVVVTAAPRADADIARDVDEAIANYPATRSAGVKVTVAGATVTLGGTTDSSAQRDLVAELASRVQGVRDVRLALTVRRASPRSDSEIAGDATDTIHDDARLDGALVAVAVHAGVATLTGTVGSLAERDAAVEDAREAGAADVDSRGLRIDWRENERLRAATRRPPPTDDFIATAVRRRLSNDARVGAATPAVSAAQGVVTLSGTVGDFRADRAAVRDARRVSGVVRVEDRITVLPAKRQADATIEKQALRGIYEDVAAPDTRGVQVLVANAKVTLRGSVASPEDRRVIEDDVEEVPGVVAVQDDLKIRGYGPQTVVVPPDAVRSRVRESIFWDPRVGPGEVQVQGGHDGDVTLGGAVDTWQEARAAVDDAVRAGAAHVTDDLHVADAPGDAGR